MMAHVPMPAGCRLIVHARIGSTSDEAKRLASDGEAAWTVVWAGEQTAGRGRRARGWRSPPGNLYCSTVLRPDCAPAAAMQLGFAAAIAVAETVAPLLDDTARLRLKWPNDVLLDGQKLAGILPEASVSGRQVEWLVMGIGINVVSHPDDAGIAATDLAAAGIAARPETLLPVLVAALMQGVVGWQESGFAAVRRSWLKWAMAVGSPITVRLGEAGRVAGRFGGVDDSGALLLETGCGTRVITTGEVFAVKSIGAEANE